MKSLKSLVVAIALSVALFSCGENNYRPSPTTSPVTVNPYGAQTGNTMYPGGTYPGMNGGMTPGMNPYLLNNGTYTAQIRSQASNTMFSCAQRATPNFYRFMTEDSDCALLRVPMYTPSSCACTQTPCNCEAVLSQMRAEKYEALPDYSSVTATSLHQGPASTHPITNNSKDYGLAIRNEDAKELYIRLAKLPENTENDTQTQIVTGINYKCLMDHKGESVKDFTCDLYVSVADGSVLQQYPVGQSGVPALQVPAVYQSKGLLIGTPGLNPNEGIIKIGGAAGTDGAKIASYLYNKLNVPVTQGIVDRNQPIQASIKMGRQVKCFMTQNTSSPIVECRIRIGVANGDAANAI